MIPSASLKRRVRQPKALFDVAQWFLSPPGTDASI